MTTAEWIALGQMLTGMAGVGLVGLGLHQMRRAGDQREKREDARHREAMAALQQQGESLQQYFRQQDEYLRQQSESLSQYFRQQDEYLRQQGEYLRQQSESLGQQGELLRQQTESLSQQTESLRVLIERTAPKGT